MWQQCVMCSCCQRRHQASVEALPAMPLSWFMPKSQMQCAELCTLQTLFWQSGSGGLCTRTLLLDSFCVMAIPSGTAVNIEQLKAMDVALAEANVPCCRMPEATLINSLLHLSLKNRIVCGFPALAWTIWHVHMHISPDCSSPGLMQSAAMHHCA